MSDDNLIKSIDCALGIAKWFTLQIFLYFLMPYLWNYEYGLGTIVSILVYTTLFVAYWEFIPREKRLRKVYFPYLVYGVIVTILFHVVDHWSASLFACWTLPFYGLVCLIFTRLFQKISKRMLEQYKMGIVIKYSLIILFFLVLKIFGVSYMSKEYQSLDSEKEDILERKNYLVDKLVTTPKEVLGEMPSAIGTQFQGEWALYSCSMFSASLVNLSRLYPETKAENLQCIDSLIHIVMSPEMRYYDTMRWNEDPLESLHGDNSHVSYLSHLAWMICGYKELGGSNKYDKLLSSLCETMNHRIVLSKGFNLPTYPGEAIYIPDMLVAIVALNKYADLNKGAYRSTVKKWINKAKNEWMDNETGLLVSYVDESGKPYPNAPVKGSYSALNCYYLTFIDEALAKQQYEKLKTLFWKDGFISGLKEFWNRFCPIGLDIDAGPILFELSPSGTAFFAGSSTFFNDLELRKEILSTAEIAGHTIKLGNQRHYLLADVALVGESIMLAMRTHFKRFGE